MLLKVSSGETPEYIRSLSNKSTSRYGSNNCIPPRPRIDLYKTSLAFSGSSIWNSLPLSIKHLRTIRCFKKHLHTHLSSIWLRNRANCLLSSELISQEYLKKKKLNLHQTSFAFSGSSIWNSLPLSLKNCEPSDASKGTYIHILAPSNLSTVPTAYYPP